MRGCRGFTLIEVLLGLVLLALVLSLIQGVYAGVTKSRDRARMQTEGAHQAALVLAHLADELASASADSALVLEAGSDRNARLEFTTTLPGLMPEKADAGPPATEEYARLLYEVETGDDGVRRLVRSDARLSGRGEEGEKDVVLERVTRFRAQASEDGKAWDDRREAETEAGPLRAILFELGWEEGDPSKPREKLLRTMVPVYAGAP